MKLVFHSLLVFAFLEASPHSAMSAENPEEIETDRPFYLHAFTPNPDGSNETVHLITIRFVPSREIEVVTKWSFKGRIEFRDGRLFADLETSFNGGSFSGQVETGERFETSMMLASPAVRFCSFAVTRSKDPEEFLARPYFQVLEGQNATAPGSSSKSNEKSKPE